MAGRIRTGIGGWTFPPWRGVFYPEGLRQADELAYAASKLGAIEINGTYYSLQKPASFAAWAAATPEDFVFAIKASRFCTNRRVLGDAGEAIERFMGQGLTELGPKLGPILWQFMATKKFDPEDFAAFLALLPKGLGGRPLRHCVEVRHASFATEAFVDLARAHNVAICASENPDYPLIADVTADFVYARLMKGCDEIDTGYEPAALDAWADRFRAYAGGGSPMDLPLLAAKATAEPRDAFAFFISAGKVRAPAAAMALAERLAPA
jgi:uncharacterized protein YecE (DUF72 family)